MLTKFSASNRPEGTTDADGVIPGSGVSFAESAGEIAGEPTGEVAEVVGPLAAGSPKQIQV